MQITVVAIALGRIPAEVNCRCTCGKKQAITPTTPIPITTHFAAAFLDGLALARYCTDAMKLMKKSRKAVQAEGT